MRRWTPVAALVALVAMLAACAGRVAPSGASLEGTYWRLVELGGRPAAGTGHSREAHLEFAADGGRVTGSTGCNRLTGSFTRDAAMLRFGATATTRMACLDPSLNAQEQRFLAVLRDTERHEIAGDTLTLIGAGGTLARLVVAPRPQ